MIEIKKGLPDFGHGHRGESNCNTPNFGLRVLLSIYIKGSKTSCVNDTFKIYDYEYCLS